MRCFWISLAIVIIGATVFILAIYGMSLAFSNYKMILPTSLSEFINYYFGKAFKSVSDVVFLGVICAVGIVLIYYGFYIMHIFRK
jgi:hypothetical protein